MVLFQLMALPEFPPPPPVIVPQIYGTGFVNRTGLLYCRFGEDNIVEALFASSNVVQCSAPARSEPGAIDVAVSIDGGASFGHALLATVGHFRYMAHSFVSGLSPRNGPETGGTVIAVLGAGFSSDLSFTCSFPQGETENSGDGERVTTSSAVVHSSSELTCIAPPVTSGTEQLGQDVQVTVSVDLEGDGSIFTPLPTSTFFSGETTGVISANTMFMYVPTVQLSALSPDHGPTSGGTVVDISGTNFLPRSGINGTGTTSDTIWCRFGSIATIGSHLSDGIIQCRSPPRDVGAAPDVEITVSVNSGSDFAGGPSGSPLVRACCFVLCVGSFVAMFLWRMPKRLCARLDLCCGGDMP